VRVVRVVRGILGFCPLRADLTSLENANDGIDRQNSGVELSGKIASTRQCTTRQERDQRGRERRSPWLDDLSTFWPRLLLIIVVRTTCPPAAA
jgi:hypothetical protein